MILQFSARKTQSKEPQLIDFIKTILSYPSENKLLKISTVVYKTSQAEEIDKILNKKVICVC